MSRSRDAVKELNKKVDITKTNYEVIKNIFFIVNNICFHEDRKVIVKVLGTLGTPRTEHFFYYYYYYYNCIYSRD